MRQKPKIFVYITILQHIMELDLTDRKILYHLDLNSRQSFSQIGKKLGIHKDVVARRVKKLFDNGIIKFITCTNDYKLGFFYLRFCFTYQYVTPEIKNKIIDYFVNNKYAVTVIESEGPCDLIAIMAVKNAPVFYPMWYNIFSKYRDFFSNLAVSIYCEVIEYKYSFLLDEKEQKKEDRVWFKRYDDGILVTLDDVDYKILRLLNNNARVPTIEIAKKLNTTVDTIQNRIQKLIKSRVILGFRITIDYSKIGYQLYRLQIFLKDHTQVKNIIDYIESNPNLVRRIVSLGNVDLEFMFFFQNLTELNNVMNDLSSKFPGAIKNYSYITHTKTYKYQYSPDE
jgi:Lrp/AsnC family transcriptional regulator for asnA, asnC and gidA